MKRPFVPVVGEWRQSVIKEALADGFTFCRLWRQWSSDDDPENDLWEPFDEKPRQEWVRSVRKSPKVLDVPRSEKEGRAVARRSWYAMRYRCHNPKNQAYKYYGAKGISVCAEWREDFEAFYAHIGPPPALMAMPSVDRIDPAKGYVPGNCRWLDRGENSARIWREASDEKKREIRGNKIRGYAKASRARKGPKAGRKSDFDRKEKSDGK